MKWEKIKFESIADFSNGINFDKSAYAPGVKLIGVSDFKENFFPNYADLSEVKSDIVRDTDYLADGDIIFVRSNGNKELVGRCMLIKNPPIPVTFSGFCIRARIRNFEKYDPTFFAYHFKYAGFRKAMAGTSIGANIQNLSQKRLATYSAFIPDIKIQRHIAEILSVYDHLIENNQKQIKLLEEAAQRLYKEWFVDLRFPGYETTPVVDGVPEGWRNGNLQIIAEFKRGKTITRSQIAPGNIPVVAGGLEPAYYHNQANTTAPVITVSGSGANAGFTRMYYMDVFASDCSFVDINSTPYVYFVYCFLKESKSILDSLQKGSAQPHVYAKEINTLSLLIPNKKYMELFVEKATPLFTKIQTLEKQIKLATEARDRLLPKLMNGELEV